MNSLKLKNFKAYTDEFKKLDLKNKNFLLYGEINEVEESIDLLTKLYKRLGAILKVLR